MAVGKSKTRIFGWVSHMYEQSWYDKNKGCLKGIPYHGGLNWKRNIKSLYQVKK